MSRFLKIYMRKIHRWLAIPTIILIPFVIINSNSPTNFQIQRFQQIFMLGLALTGLYLLILPWWSRWMKNKNKEK